MSITTDELTVQRNAYLAERAALAKRADAAIAALSGAIKAVDDLVAAAKEKEATDAQGPQEVTAELYAPENAPTGVLHKALNTVSKEAVKAAEEECS